LIRNAPERTSVYQQGHELVLAHLLRSGIGKVGSLPEAHVLAEQKQAVPNHAARRTSNQPAFLTSITRAGGLVCARTDLARKAQPELRFE